MHQGIWIDWQNQNLRITGNIIYNTVQEPIFLEKGVGGNLVDNNVIVSSSGIRGIKQQSHQLLFVHNLMVSSGRGFGGDGRTPSYFGPHSYGKRGTWTMDPGGDRIYNNIIANTGMGSGQTTVPSAADYNVYYNGAAKTGYEGTHSRVVAFNPGVTITPLANGAQVTLSTDAGFPGMTAPIVTNSMLGDNSKTGIPMEEPDGTRIDVTNDLFGVARASNPTPGPFEGLGRGTNTYTLVAGASFYNVILTSAAKVGVPENGTATFQVRLSAQPTGAVRVAVANRSGDPDIHVQAGAGLTFTTNNWNTDQTVTLAGAADADVLNGEATIICSGIGLFDAIITATEIDSDRAAGNGTGLNGEYYSNQDFTNLKLTRTDPTVNFDWGNGAPDPSMGADNFSVRWTGQVQAEVSETYTFYTVTDDGVRLWINGQLLIDHWIAQGPKEYSASLALTAGQKYDIKMEYYDNGGGAVAKLLWYSPSTVKEIIPSLLLYPVGRR